MTTVGARMSLARRRWPGDCNCLAADAPPYPTVDCTEPGFIGPAAARIRRATAGRNLVCPGHCFATDRVRLAGQGRHIFPRATCPVERCTPVGGRSVSDAGLALGAGGVFNVACQARRARNRSGTLRSGTIRSGTGSRLLLRFRPPLGEVEKIAAHKVAEVAGRFLTRFHQGVAAEVAPPADPVLATPYDARGWMERIAPTRAGRLAARRTRGRARLSNLAGCAWLAWLSALARRPWGSGRGDARDTQSLGHGRGHA